MSRRASGRRRWRRERTGSVCRHVVRGRRGSRPGGAGRRPARGERSGWSAAGEGTIERPVGDLFGEREPCWGWRGRQQDDCGVEARQVNQSMQSIFVTLKRFSALLSRGYDARNLNAAITDLIRSSSLRDALAPSLLREPLFSRHDFTVISLPSK